MTTLILPPRYTPDTIAVSNAAGSAGWQVERLSSWRVPEGFRPRSIAFYGEPLFAQIVAPQLDISLIEPTWDWLPELPSVYRRREVRMATLEIARSASFPAFVKPADDKCFSPGVYATREEFASKVTDLSMLPPSTPALIAEPVSWELEFRCFVCERKVLTMSPYLRRGELSLDADGAWFSEDSEDRAARQFIDSLLQDADVPLPPATVVDVGLIAGRGWAVVEANAAWGSGIYGCDPVQVLKVLRRACVLSTLIPPADKCWIIQRGSEVAYDATEK